MSWAEDMGTGALWNETESLGKFKNAIKQLNLHPVLTDYAKDTLLGLGFFKE